MYGLFAVHMNEIEAPIWFGWGDYRLPRHSRTKKAVARLLTPNLVAKSRGITRINSQANTEDIGCITGALKPLLVCHADPVAWMDLVLQNFPIKRDIRRDSKALVLLTVTVTVAVCVTRNAASCGLVTISCKAQADFCAWEPYFTLVPRCFE